MSLFGSFLQNVNPATLDGKTITIKGTILGDAPTLVFTHASTRYYASFAQAGPGLISLRIDSE